jgi:Kelch motif/Galactose oxidase, central domain
MNGMISVFLRLASVAVLSSLCLVAFAGSFNPTASMTTARRLHTATLLANGTVLVAGGGGIDGPFLASAEIYNPATNSWSSAGSMAVDRGRHTAVLLQNGKVLVAGGTGNPFLDPNATVELYDPTNNTWSNAASMAGVRQLHTATLLPDGKVLVVGGRDGNFPLASAEIYDPATDTWSIAANLSVARAFHTASLLANNKVLVAGGQGLASTALYDIGQDRWDAGPDLQAARSGHTATTLLNGQVLVAGGANGGTAVAAAELYDPASDAWTSAGALVDARFAHAASLLPNGNVLLAGGNVRRSALGGNTTGATAEIYDLQARLWMDTGDMTSARAEHTATRLPDGRVLFIGGVRIYPPPSAALATAEVYDPGSISGTAFAPGMTSVDSWANGYPTIVISLPVICPAAGAVLVAASGESTASSNSAGAMFIGLAYSIARNSPATDNSNVVQSSALAVFNGDANRDFLNVQRVDSCTPGLTSGYRLTAYRTTPGTNAGNIVWNGRLTVSEALSSPGAGVAAGTSAIGSTANASPTIITTLPVTCPAAGAVLVTASGESTALSSVAGRAFIGLAYSIARDSVATDNSNVVQSSALAVFNGDANRDLLNAQRVDSCSPGVTATYRLTAYRTTPETSAASFVWNGRLTASEPLSSPGAGIAAGTSSIGSAANATPTIITTLPITCPATGSVLVSGSGESTALSSYAGTAFIGLAYSIARDSVGTDNSNVVQSSALAVFSGDANRDFLNVQRVDSCSPGVISTYRLTAYRTTPDTSAASFVWNGRLTATTLP